MRKLLIGILIIVLLVLAGYMLIDRINIGSLEILGIEAIAEKNDELDQKILEETRLSTVTYQEKLDKLYSANKQLQQEKEKYQNYVSTDNGTGAVSQIQSYEVEYLWTKIGNYAKREGVVLKMDVAINNPVIGTYDLNFTVAGTYVGITEFIYDLDNDSSLLFKVENFKLLPNGSQSTTSKTNTDKEADGKQTDEDKGNTSSTESESLAPLVATFTCRDISINIDSSSVSQTGNVLNENTSENNDETEKNKKQSENNTTVTQ